MGRGPCVNKSQLAPLFACQIPLKSGFPSALRGIAELAFWASTTGPGFWTRRVAASQIPLITTAVTSATSASLLRLRIASTFSTISSVSSG